MKKIITAEKLSKLPPYIFARINVLKAEAYRKNLDVIDLGMGNPDMAPPQCVVDRLCDTVQHHPRTHRYPQAKGMPKFRKVIAEWMHSRFGVTFNPDHEVLALIGSKEGEGHLCMAFLNPGDLVLSPDPGYPIYYNGVVLANGKMHAMPITEKTNYLPEFHKIPESVARKSKIMFLNYPNNPTAAVVEDKAFYVEAVKFCKKYGIILVHDAAYSEITFDGYVAPSIFEIPGAKDVSVEFHSFSKTYSMAGWRAGFAVGNEYIIKAVEKFKSFVDYGLPTFTQLSCVMALKEGKDYIAGNVKVYQERRDKFIREMSKIGWDIPKSKGTMYLWAKLPEKFQKIGSLKFAEELLRQTGVVVSPGAAFGEYGEGYVRIALVTHINRFHDAALRIKEFFKSEII